MTSTDAQALIEEARERYAAHSPAQWPMDCPACAVRRLADALESAEAARKDLTDKIEALMSVIPIMHERIIRGGPTNYLDRFDHHMDRTQRDLIAHLVLGDKKRSGEVVHESHCRYHYDGGCASQPMFEGAPTTAEWKLARLSGDSGTERSDG